MIPSLFNATTCADPENFFQGGGGVRPTVIWVFHGGGGHIFGYFIM